MGFVKLIFGVMGVGAIAAAGVTGCGSSTASTTSGPGGSTTTSSGTTMTTSSGGCAPKASCTAVDKTCIGLVDNTGLTKFGLRMSELDVTSPPALTTGIIAGVIGGAVLPDVKSCNVDGAATFNWLLEFDTVAGTLRTGGAKPVTDPTMGYAFDMDMVAQGTQMFDLSPVTFMTKPDPTSGAFSVATGQKLIVPIFLDPAGTMVVILPLQAARLKMGTLSTSQNCIGTYNDGTGPTALQPSGSCQPQSTPTVITSFVDGAALDGFITLEDADTVVIGTLSETLCVLLAGMSNGDGASPTSHCKRDPTTMKILFQGGWCSTTNAAASATTCADSEQLTANFAASSIKITN
jgi:hypothetical protein